MKEAQIFENWINNLSEGTWALPETPEQMEKLNQLMSAELIVGPDATNATEQLYDIIGDDELFDILNDLADKSEGRANIWDDSDVQRRLAELGVQTPQSTEAEPADVPQDTAPAVKEGDMAEGLDPEKKQRLKDLIDQYRDATDPEASYELDAEEVIAQIRQEFGDRTADSVEQGPSMHYPRPGHSMGYDPMQYKSSPRITKSGVLNKQDVGSMKRDIKQRFKQDMDEGDNQSTFVEDRELAEMLKYAGVPIREGVLNDDTRNTWDHLLDRFRHEVEQFRQGSDLDSDLYDALFDYYDQHGAMPYRVRNAKDGTANQWISSRLADDLGIDEGVLGTVGGAALGGMLGGPVGAAVGSTAGQEMTKGGSNIIEGSCNMTMEGEYCPEHGLMECGSIEEDGGAVGMPYSMGEGTDDPINSNSAMTGSYYEGKETKTQEGDALLARIKSLALLR